MASPIHNRTLSTFYYWLAWLLKVTPTVYPHLNDFTGKLNFSKPWAKNNLVGLPSFPIKIWGKSINGFLSYDPINNQTDKQKLQLYIYIDDGDILIFRQEIEFRETGIPSRKNKEFSIMSPLRVPSFLLKELSLCHKFTFSTSYTFVI